MATRRAAFMWGHSTQDPETKNARARELRAQRKAAAAETAALATAWGATRWLRSNGETLAGPEWLTLAGREDWVRERLALPVGAHTELWGLHDFELLTRLPDEVA